MNDVLIAVKMVALDGWSGTLAKATPCALDRDHRVRYGLVQIDLADDLVLKHYGLWETVVTHELLHVLGFGTMFDYMGLISTSKTAPIEYYGQFGIEGNHRIGFQGPPLVQADGGSGVERVHWDDSTYGDELMTGYINTYGENPLSPLTLWALKDLGYQVDESKADKYNPASRRALREAAPFQIAYGDDVNPHLLRRYTRYREYKRTS